MSSFTSPIDKKYNNKMSMACTYYANVFQIVLENCSREDKHECPFGRSAIELTRMLCDILQVGELRKYSVIFLISQFTDERVGLCL